MEMIFLKTLVRETKMFVENISSYLAIKKENWSFFYTYTSLISSTMSLIAAVPVW